MIINIHILGRNEKEEIFLTKLENNMYGLPMLSFEVRSDEENNLNKLIHESLQDYVEASTSNLRLFNNTFYSNNILDISVTLLEGSRLRNEEEYQAFNYEKMQQLEVQASSKKILDDLFTSEETELKKQHKDVYVVGETSIYDELIIYTDGGSRGNPGPSASGFVIFNKDNELIDEGGEYLGVTTNNQAEYQAVKLALEQAAKHKAKKIKFNIDSELVVKQINGIYKIRNRDLWPVHSKIKELINLFEGVEFNHVRREYNKEADAKVNQILDSHSNNN